MKIIHCSDIHLGSPIESLSSEKALKRKAEIRHTFDKLCEFATNNQVSVVIIAGDLFDSSSVSEFTINQFLYSIEKNSHVDFLYLQGNHDPKSLFERELPKNLKFFGGSWSSFRYGNVVINGAKISENNSEILAESLKINKEDINIVVLHGQIAGYKNIEKAEIISLPYFKDKNIDYIALGHYHSFSEGILDDRCKYAYSGCLDGRGFDELGQKGFVLLETNQDLRYEFVPFSSRVFYEFTFDVSEYKSYFELKDKALDLLKRECSAKSLIKITLKGEYTTDFDIDLRDFKACLSEIFFFVKLNDFSTVKIDAGYTLDKSIKGEFITEVMNSKLSEETKKQVIMCGIKALRGEEI